jgi:hypothetical protein
MFGMGLLDEMQRADLRRAMSRARERSKMRHSGYYTVQERREAPTKLRISHSITWQEALRSDNCECIQCGDWMELISVIEVDRKVEKIWWCQFCNLASRGAYRIFVIPEWPGRD